MILARVAMTGTAAALIAAGCGVLAADNARSEVHTEPISVLHIAPATTTTKTTVPPVPLASFAGMWSYELGDEAHDAELCGYLIIEEPYVHVLATEHGWDPGIDPGLSRNANDGSLIYYWINLPRSGTRYDPATRAIWVWNDGPMTDGDHVSLGGSAGGANTEAPSDRHSSDSWLATSMMPVERPCGGVEH